MMRAMQHGLPREKLLLHGTEVLNDAELIAILLRTGHAGIPVVTLAERLLREAHGLAGLSAVPLEQLRAMPGMGCVKALTLIAAIEVARRWNRARRTLPEALLSSQQVFDRYRCQFRHRGNEHLLVVCLDAKNRPLREVWLSNGSSCDVCFSPRPIFAAALASHAVGIIVVHNHPSGDVTPSPQDLETTQHLLVTGRLLHLPLLDHLIVTDDGFVSLRDTGCLGRGDE